MKTEMSSVDIRYVVDELKGIEGARVDKIYHTGDTIRIKLHKAGEGRKDLLIQAGKRIHLTTYITESPNPSSFAMLLRKHLSGRFLDSIEQHDFDRIVKLRFGEFTLVAELFRRGNVVFLNGEGKILGALRYEEFKDRAIKPGREYEFPPARESPLNVTWERFLELVGEEEVEIVRALARRFNMGGLFAEEILLRAGVEKTKKVPELGEEELRRVFDAMGEVFTSPKKAQIVYRGGEPFDVLPIELLQYAGFEKKYFPTFSAALDEYFGNLTVAEAKKALTKRLEDKKRAILHTLRKQEELMKGFEAQARANQELGDIIYANFALVERLLTEFRNAVERLGWEEFKRRIEQGKKAGNQVALMVKAIDPKEKAVTIELNGKKLRLYIDRSIGENAEVYYEKAKRAKHKLEGARRAYEDTMKKLDEVEKLIEEEMKKETGVRKLERRKKKWFEKFRWFISSEGFLVIGGKDATTNEMVVKKHMEPDDWYCHADVYGAPHVVVKDGKKASDKTLFEACQFAVSMSKAWSRGVFSEDAYYADPSQVTKQAPSGEYLGKGAFMVYGKRNWMHGLPVKLAVGVVEYEGEKLPMCGPVDAVKSHTDRYVVIRPGRHKKSEFVKRIKKILEKWGYSVSEEDLMAILPPGNGEIEKVVGE